MEYEKIKQLIDEMGNSKLTEIDIEFPDGTKISMKKDFIITVSDNHISCKLNLQPYKELD